MWYAREVLPQCGHDGSVALALAERHGQPLHGPDLVDQILRQLGLDVDDQHFLAAVFGLPRTRFHPSHQRVPPSRVPHPPGAAYSEFFRVDQVSFHNMRHGYPARGGLLLVTDGTPITANVLIAAPRWPISISRTLGRSLLGCSMVTTNFLPPLSAIAFR